MFTMDKFFLLTPILIGRDILMNISKYISRKKMYWMKGSAKKCTFMGDGFFFSGTIFIFLILLIIKKKLLQSQFFNRDVIFHWFDVQTSEKLHPRLKKLRITTVKTTLPYAIQI